MKNKNCVDCGTLIWCGSTRCKSCANKNEYNNNWKGDDVTKKNALHTWIKARKPKPEFCEKCNKKKSYDLANISGKYKRDINDFEWLCRSCHMKKDGRLKKLGGYDKKGKNNPRWKGGISYTYKKRIKEEAGRKISEEPKWMKNS